MAYTSLLISSFPPFGNIALSLPSDTSIAELPEIIGNRIGLDVEEHDLSLSLAQRPLALDEDPISALEDDVLGRLVTLRLIPRLVGGKGGFGSQLRAAGGRMSSQKTSNNDSCRDLNGRRLSTVKEAKKIAQYLEDEPLRKQADLEARKAKLEALEKQLGISTQETNAEAGPSNAADKGKGKEPEKVAGKKHRFDDTEYLEQSEAILDNVKSAVAAGKWLSPVLCSVVLGKLTGVITLQLC
ncbi:hypothetical protein M407DRAFT_200028 [Tulasnella calospora MUT 4182]|uniref:Uncharacterized protein n=1 Tax=Tulasnella calospora MUT 4182 TaxID=1051891 RepID=A0A0C3LYP3_9AGAM|nr:hypothetical protein M407DRAFT_200028 [Tulasnella calospora MUT 4182]